MPNSRAILTAALAITLATPALTQEADIRVGVVRSLAPVEFALKVRARGRRFEAARGQSQAITTKTLVIYGTGRGGGVPGATPRLFAVDKATGAQVGALAITARTTAMPMTFMHGGRQYIVFASGAEDNASLTALALPRK